MIILLVIGLCMISSSIAAPVSEDAQAKILQYYDNTNDGKGNYEFSFETSNGISRSESGTLVNEGQPDEHIAVQGFYIYTDSDGKIVQVNYTADENGYQIISQQEIPVPMVVQALPASAVASLLG